MSERLKQLQRLAAELHEVNQELVRAGRPLKWLPDLDDEQRREFGVQLRAGQARWEDVTRRISQVLQTDSANGS